jgi:PadR family transcriptional regulator, regulatory protein AphA
MTSHELNSSQDKTRNPAEYPVLGILARCPAHGYDICLRLSEEIGSIWRLSKSNIYALLVRLERDGLVTHERVGQENLPAKNIFKLTKKGMEVYKDWITTPVRHVRDMRLEFLTKLWCAQQLGDESEIVLVKGQLAVCREKIEILEDLRASSGNEIERRSLSFRLTMIHAAVGWLGDTLNRMESCECAEKGSF